MKGEADARLRRNARSARYSRKRASPTQNNDSPRWRRPLPAEGHRFKAGLLPRRPGGAVLACVRTCSGGCQPAGTRPTKTTPTMLKTHPGLSRPLVVGTAGVGATRLLGSEGEATRGADRDSDLAAAHGRSSKPRGARADWRRGPGHCRRQRNCTCTQPRGGHDAGGRRACFAACDRVRIRLRNGVSLTTSSTVLPVYLRETLPTWVTFTIFRAGGVSAQATLPQPTSLMGGPTLPIAAVTKKANLS